MTKKHNVTFYRQISKPKEGEAGFVSLEEIHEAITKFAANAIDVSDKNKEQLNEYKAHDALSIVAAKMVDNTKSNINFVSRSLLTIDIDHKDKCYSSIQEVMELLKQLNLKSSIYTTISHRSSTPRYRVIIDIGKDCNESEFKQAARWFIQLLPDEVRLAVDSASERPVQAMILPVAYVYQKPSVYWVDGDGIFPQHEVDVNTIVLPDTKKNNSGGKSKGGSGVVKNDHFLKHVSLMHRLTNFSKVTSSSYQFKRNSKDEGAGLFCRSHDRVIHENNPKYQKKPLMYSPDDFQEACNHSLPTRDEVYQGLSEWAESDVRCAVLKENCGSGKSQSLVKLTDHDPSEKQFIFTFHMKDNRDNFFNDCNLNKANCVLIYGNTDIISKVITDKERYELINVDYKSFHDERMKKIIRLKDKISNDAESDKPSKIIASIEDLKSVGIDGTVKSIIEDTHAEFSFSKYLQKLQRDKLITASEKKEIVRQYQKNQRQITTDKHLIMTTRKFELLVSTNDVNTYLNSVVFTDEVELGCLTPIPAGSERTAYQYPKKIKDESDTDKRLLQKIRRCFITVEDGIEHELTSLKIPFTSISGICKTLDHNLEVFRVRSTSNNEKDTAFYGDDTPREYCIKKIKQTYGDTVEIIVDGGKDLECFVNHTNNKGKNNLQDKDLIVIVSYPDPVVVAKTMFVTGLPEKESIQLIMSNNANQAIGRNQGYRNRNQLGEPSKGNNKCLLVLPDSVDLNLHNVTSNVITLSRWDHSHAESILSNDRINMHYRSFYYNYCNETDHEKTVTNSVNAYIENNPDSIEIDIDKLDYFTGSYAKQKKTIHKRLKKMGYNVSLNTGRKVYVIKRNEIPEKLCVTDN